MDSITFDKQSNAKEIKRVGFSGRKETPMPKGGRRESGGMGKGEPI